MRKLVVITVLLLLCSALAEESLYTASDFTREHEFTEGIEGPCVGPDGLLYVVNFGSEGTVGRVGQDGATELFVKLPQGSVGNGIRFRSDGRMLIADYKGHNILTVDMKTKAVSTWVHEPRMHQPNDIAIAKNGAVFASDPDWSNNTGQLWRIRPNGKVELVEGGMGTTNGIEVSPDGRFLYVNESIQRKIWRYELDRTSQPKHKRLLAEFPDYGLDGMRCDSAGNLYVARYGKGTVVKLSPAGTVLREIVLKGKRPSNLAFGGKDRKTVFVTLQDRGSIEMFRVD